MLLKQLTDLAVSLARFSTGKSSAAKIPITAITASSSSSVNAAIANNLSIWPGLASDRPR